MLQRRAVGTFRSSSGAEISKATAVGQKVRKLERNKRLVARAVLAATNPTSYSGTLDPLAVDIPKPALSYSVDLNFPTHCCSVLH